MTRGQEGQTLVVFTIVCALILLGTIALVGNTQVLFVNSNRADAAALLAAQAGASAIDTDALYQDHVQLNVTEAGNRCHDAVAAQSSVLSVKCIPDIHMVTATVVERVDMPIPLWSSFETVSATRTARPAYGGTTGGFPSS
jgi:hypothetical protein